MRVAYIKSNIGRFYKDSIYVSAESDGLNTCGQNASNCESGEDAALLFYRHYPDGEIKSESEVVAMIARNNIDKVTAIAKTSKTYEGAMKRCDYRCSQYLPDAWAQHGA